MPKVTLPDDSQLSIPEGASFADVAAAISPGLARAAIAAKKDGQLVDLSRSVDEDCRVEIVKPDAENPESLEVLRHSCAHVMAEAICELFPDTKLVYGPPVDNGFYYDIDLDRPLSQEDFDAIEARMTEIVKSDKPFTRYEMSRDEGLAKLREEGSRYKIENAERAEGDLSFYVTGSPTNGNFEDLCRGPHVPSTGKVGAFKLMQVSGAYYRGDQREKQLQRVYGTCWPSKKELKRYLAQLEEARKRDHRRLGQELDLFSIDPLVGSGLILWKPRGAQLRMQLENYLRGELMKSGYNMVYSPQIGKLGLYRTSGHFPYYKESQFPAIFENPADEILNQLWEQARDAADEQAMNEAVRVGIEQVEAADPTLGKTLAAAAQQGKQALVKKIESALEASDGYLLRPMNCPHHIRM